MFSVREMPPSPWQPTHSSAFSLPAAISAAWAEEPNNSPANTIKAKVIRISTLHRHCRPDPAIHPASKEPCEDGSICGASPRLTTLLWLTQFQNKGCGNSFEPPQPHISNATCCS